MDMFRLDICVLSLDLRSDAPMAAATKDCFQVVIPVVASALAKLVSIALRYTL